MSTPRLLLNGKEIKNATTTDFNVVKHIIDGSKSSGNEEISFGFSSFTELELWLNKQSREEQRLYEFLFNLRRMAIKESSLTAADQAKIKEFQINKVSRGINPLNTPIELYQYADYSGKKLSLETGAYGNLGNFDFDNKTTSYKSRAGCFAMFQFKGYEGKSYIRLRPKNQPRMDWWNNRLSSLLYGSYYDIASWLLEIGIILL